jgi:acetyltransferase-like isoleucine patch superfamily enzyme
MKKDVLIHKSSIVETSKIGVGSSIWAFVHILNDVEIGKNVNICDHCFIENGVRIGDDVTIKCGVWIWDGILIKNKVFVGPSVTFTNDLYPRSKNKKYEKRDTILEEGCSIGASSTILAGIKIGKYSMIGAGSVVTKDVGDHELIYGNPARKTGYICKCGKKLDFDLNNICRCSCGLKYSLNEERVDIID